MTGATPDPLVILVVCTANIERSPMGEAFLRHRAGEAALPIEVSSAGFLFDGEPAADDAVAVMADLGFDLSGHRSRIVRPEMVREADLIVTMERSHARSLVLDVPDVADRVHTLGAAVAGFASIVRSEDSGAGGGWRAGAGSVALDSIRDRVVRLGEQRPASALLGSGADEVDDPHGRRRRHHRRTARRLDQLMTDLISALAVT
jgi:protein-tyrosine-phosphatase